MPVLRLLSSMRCSGEDVEVDVEDAGPGFALPADIDSLDSSVTHLDLAGCGLQGLLSGKGKGWIGGWVIGCIVWHMHCMKTLRPVKVNPCLSKAESLS